MSSLRGHRDALRSLGSALPAIAAIVVVLATYVFFATAGTWRFASAGPMDTHYANLAEGFRLGQLSMAVTASPELQRLPDPYDVEARQRAGAAFIWDASFYKGKYYLYFSPLPVLIAHLPVRLLFGVYPADGLVAVLFCTWSLFVAIALLLRLRRDVQLPIPFALCVLLVGIGNVVPFTLPNVFVHVLPVTLGMALTTTWAYATLRFLETRSVKHAAWMGVWLGLAIASRPNLAVLVPLMALIFIATRRARAALAALVPLVVTGSAMAWYNYARFGSVFEFGVRYQLGGRSMLNVTLCSLCNGPELLRFVNNVHHFVFFTPVMFSRFPFVELQLSRLDYAVSYPASEPVAGIAALLPIVIVGTLFGLIGLSARRPFGVPLKAGAAMLAAGWAILFGLSTCGGIAPRYSLDFMIIMTLGAIACLAWGFAFLRDAGISIRPLRWLSIALAAYSILLGFILGFAQAKDTFTRLNPSLVEKLW